MEPHSPPLAGALAWLRLTLAPGVNDRALRALLGVLGSPEAILDAAPRDIAHVAGETASQGLARGAPGGAVEGALRWLESPGHHLVTLGEEHYPARLLDIEDPPTVLYVNGRLDLLNAPAIAIVGSRNATPQGRRDARGFARTLSDAGLLVVSGLAVGIDAAAHRGGLEGASSSLAVMGTGADRVYPASNAGLARELAQAGALVSEFALGTSPRPGYFPQRNRLISGLSRGVLVVEAAPRSGSLGTARWALDQGRDIFAIPGSIHSPHAKGCHGLIKQGAKLVECAEDVLGELGMIGAASAPRVASNTPARDALLEVMGYTPASIDELAVRTGEDAPGIAARLARLELEGRVASVAGGRFQRLAL